MKKIVAILVLLSHMNTSMFLPQVPMEDVYDKNGQQLEDINSVVEWVLVSLGIDDVPDDEDDDTGQQFRLAQFNYYLNNHPIDVGHLLSSSERELHFGMLHEKILAAYSEVSVPPPEIYTP